MNTNRKIYFLFFYSAALIFILIVNGALPFIATPTLGQAVWTTGFSQSFLNQSFSTLYANNFGVPEPAAIAFGLVGALTAAVFMAIGMHAADAYTSMVMLWLSLAFFFAYKLARYFSVNHYLAIIAAISWCTLPMVWGHAGYSMLSIGIALLPLYLFSALKLFNDDVINRNSVLKRFFSYLAVCFLAVFMDGYTFMMFAISASLIGVWAWINQEDISKQKIYRLGIHSVSLIVAYLAFVFYIGKPQFEASSIDFFRGWGLDIAFLLTPTSNVHWIPDILGWSESRTSKDFFGDASVWTTSFALPLIIGATFSALAIKKHNQKYPLVVIALFGFYMALGPSIKFNSTKPSDYQGGALMSEEYALTPSGSSVLSLNLPGFKNMRASYRWEAMGALGAWALIVLTMSRRHRKSIPIMAATALGIITILNLPNLPKKVASDSLNREMFGKIDSQLVEVLRSEVKPSERVAFLPWRNDFLINYVAAELNIRTYNIGGDKNLSEARKHWPELIRQFQMGKVDENFADRIALLLAKQEADVVVMPYINLLWAAHSWPAIPQYRDELRPIENQLRVYGWLDVKSSEYYSTVRLRNVNGDLKSYINAVTQNNCNFVSQCVEAEVFTNSETATQVGVILDGVLMSTGEQGFLMYGPYQKLRAGSYRLQLFGQINYPTKSWLDVVSNSGQNVHAKFALDMPQDSQSDNRKLLDKIISINKDVGDIEVRVFVEGNDEVFLESYSMRLKE